MKLYINNQKGSAILIALSLITMLTMIGMFAVNSAITDVDLAFNKLHADESFYIAEAGAKQAIFELQQDENWRVGFTDVKFGDGLFTVTVIDSSIDAALVDTMIILSDATTPNAQANIEITLYPEPFNPFIYSMFGDDSVMVKNSFVTDSYNSDSGSYAATSVDSSGDIGSNGNIMVDNGAYVGGDVISSLTGGTDVHPGAIVTGDIADDIPEVDLPPIPEEEFLWAEANNTAPAGLSGSYSYDMITGELATNGDLVLADGVYYFESIELKNNASITLEPGASVTIYVRDTTYLKNGGDINAGGDPTDFLIVSQGPLMLMNSGEIYATLYTPESTADLKNSGDFYGSIIAEDIICHNSANFHYDRDLANFSKDEWFIITEVGWREL